ncbi:MAG: hypothetical protein IT167_24745 [Bryobacterales bacterium]|nr:hypothetical protein [Bryobacterales bacterium]
MRKTWLLLLVALSLAVEGIAGKKWADAAEYDLCQRAGSELVASRQIEVLREWEARYPRSEFERERLVMLAVAYERAGRAEDAFASAVRILKLDPNDIEGLYRVAVVAPMLKTPGAEQKRITEEAGRTLLARAPELGRAATGVFQPADGAMEASKDPETERVMEMVRAWRRERRVRSAEDVEGEVRRVAERALEWARNATQ